MSSTFRFITASLLVVAATFPNATAGADRKPPLVAEQKGESRREQAGEEPGTSPASVFHAAQRAMVEEDFAALSDLMTSRLRDGFALTLVVQAGMLRMLAGEADLDKLTLPEETRFRRRFDNQKRIANRIAAVMERHGLAPPEKLKEIMNRNDPATADDPESAKKARQEAIAQYLQPIQDPRAFIAEIAPLLRTDYGPNPFETNWERKFTTPNLADTRLIDLKIEGDISTGTLAVSREDLPILRIDDRDLWGSEIKFERIGGGWKLAELDLGLVSPWGTPPSPEAAAEARPVDGRTDLSGEWLMTLPAGFEHRATLVAEGENRYRLDVPQAANVLEGLYELRDGMLAVMEPDDERMTDLVWRLHNANVLLLAEQRQPSPNGANYVDATLTRQVASPK